MPIHATCPDCGATFRLADQLAGKQVRCRACGRPFRVRGDADLPTLEPAQAVAARGPRPGAAAPAYDRPRPRRRDEVPAGGGWVWILVGALGGLVGLGAIVTIVVVLMNAGREPGPAPTGAGQFAKADPPKDELKNPKKDPVPEVKPEPKLPKKKDPPAGKEPVFPAQLANNAFVSQQRLEMTDAIDPGIGGTRKVYQMMMQAGRKYAVHMASQDFDAFLRLEGPTGQQVAVDDDSGGGLNALIVYAPAQTGLYRVIATCLGGKRQGNFTLTIRDETGGKSGVQDGAKVTVAPFPADKILDDILWVGTGESFLALTEDGLLRRVALQGFVEEKKVDLGKRCGSLAVSAEGLLVAVTETQEVWVLDPNSFEVRKKIPVQNMKRVVSAPPLRVGYAVNDGGVAVLDLAKGAAVHQAKASGGHARVSPDGKYFFAQGGIEQLESYRIEGPNLVRHLASPRIAQNGQRVCVSPDAKWVCLPSGGGNYGVNYGTFVYGVEDLKNPAFTIKSGAYPRLVGFDATANLVYAQGGGKQLLVFDQAGTKVSEHQFEKLGAEGDPRQFLAHPRGKKLLALVGKHLLWIELDGGKDGARLQHPPGAALAWLGPTPEVGLAARRAPGFVLPRG